MGDMNWRESFVPKEPGDAEWAEGMRYLFDDANEKIGDVQKAIEHQPNIRLMKKSTGKGFLVVRISLEANQ